MTNLAFREWCYSYPTGTCTGFSLSEGMTDDNDIGLGCIKDCSNGEDGFISGYDYYEYQDRNTYRPPAIPNSNYNKKYELQYPNCAVNHCTQTPITFQAFRAWCSTTENCSGFSFSSSTSDPTEDSEVGYGCLKDCSKGENTHGFGSGPYDYFEKLV